MMDRNFTTKMSDKARKDTTALKKRKLLGLLIKSNIVTALLLDVNAILVCGL